MNGDVPNKVIVTDIQMPFFSMVIFMVKWAIAAIPALLILAGLWLLVLALFTGIGAGLFNTAGNVHAAMGAPPLARSIARLPATGGMRDGIMVTPECSWPHDVNDSSAELFCQMFYNMTPEQRAQALKARR